MRVSLITCTYNSEANLEHCITSVVGQDYPDIEYIVIDGGSRDSTNNIIERYKGFINTYISEEDRGIYDALNKGIEIATGEIVGLLHSDDFFADPQVVTRVVQALTESGTEAVISNIDFISSTNINKVVRFYSSRFFRPFLFRFGFQPAHPTFYTYRRNYLKFGLYNSTMKIAGDFDLLLRFLYIHSLPFKYIPDVWVKMRLGGKSTKSLKNKLVMNREILSSLRSNGIYSNSLLISLRYLFKVFSLFFRFR